MNEVTIGTKVIYKDKEYEVVNTTEKMTVLVNTADESDEPKRYRVKNDSDRYNEMFGSTTSVEADEAPDFASKKKKVTKSKPAPKKEVTEEVKPEADEAPEEVKPAPKKKATKSKEPEPEEVELSDYAWEDFLPFQNRINQIVEGKTPSERLVKASMYSTVDIFTAFMVWTFINTDRLNIDYDTICELQLDGDKPAVADADRPKEFNDQAITDLWNWLDQFGMTDKIPSVEAHKVFISKVPVEGQEYFFYLATNLGWNSFQSLKINKEAAKSILLTRTKLHLEDLI